MLSVIILSSSIATCTLFPTNQLVVLSYSISFAWWRWGATLADCENHKAQSNKIVSHFFTSEDILSILGSTVASAQHNQYSQVDQIALTIAGAGTGTPSLLTPVFVSGYRSPR